MPTHNTKLLKQSVELSLIDAARAQYPVPFRADEVYSSDYAKERILRAVLQNATERTFGSRPVYYEMPKPLRSSRRMLTWLPIDQAAEYIYIARHFGVKSKSIQDEQCFNTTSYSFKPQTKMLAEMWDGDMADPRNRWRSFRERCADLFEQNSHCYATDVEAFFDNVSHKVLNSAIETLYREPFVGVPTLLDWLSERLFSLLGFWTHGKSIGLPQSSSASFFFAELPLLLVDRELSSPVYVIARYVDDYRILGPTEYAVAHHFELLEALLEQMGLRLNPSKSELQEAYIFGERLRRLDRKVDEFKSITRGISRPTQRISIALGMLREELEEGDVCRHWVSYLMSTVKNNLKRTSGISDNLLSDLLECFSLHHSVAGDALMVWLPIFAATIAHGAVQELLASIIVTHPNLLETDKAFCYGCFVLADEIHVSETRDKLLAIWENEANSDTTDATGSKTALTYKAVRAAQKHGKGNDLFMALYERNTPMYDGRLYSAVAATNFVPQQQQEILRRLRTESRSVGEQLAIEYIEHFGEPSAPERSISSVSIY